MKSRMLICGISVPDSYLDAGNKKERVGYGLRITDYGLGVTGYELRIYDLTYAFT